MFGINKFFVSWLPTLDNLVLLFKFTKLAVHTKGPRIYMGIYYYFWKRNNKELHLLHHHYNLRRGCSRGAVARLTNTCTVHVVLKVVLKVSVGIYIHSGTYIYTVVHTYRYQQRTYLQLYSSIISQPFHCTFGQAGHTFPKSRSGQAKMRWRNSTFIHLCQI